MLSLPHVIAACRRVLGVSIAIAAAAWAWSGDAAVAWAGCGDDLMPLHADAADDAATGVATLPLATIDAGGSRLARSAPPCDGPQCGEAPAGQAGFAAVPQLVRSGPGLTALAATPLSQAPPMIGNQWIAWRLGTPSFFPAALFRPPSVVAH